MQAGTRRLEWGGETSGRRGTARAGVGLNPKGAPKENWRIRWNRKAIIESSGNVQNI